ncbi:MAG: hypothetical protein HPY44_17035 [Armatimonadetes bacterium]|nr:hypothetical protein [Armatimonadota bacterium]
MNDANNGNLPDTSTGYGRSIILGAVLLAVLVGVTPYNDYFIQGSYMASHHVPVAATFVLFLLTALINPLLGRLCGRSRLLGTRELVLVWAMTAISSGLPSSGLMRFLVPVLPALRQYASPENKWEETLFPLIPDWLVPVDDRAIRWFYDGAPPGEGIPWAAWAGPIIAWSVLALLIYWVLLCAAVLIRSQWIHRERMTFPHVQLPLAMIEAPEPGRTLNRFLGDRLMWIGFTIVFVIYGVTGLSNYIPTVPKVSVLYPHYYNSALRFDGLPWNAANPILLAIFPSVVGFSFLLTTEVALSVWVFYIIAKLQAVAFAAMGLQMQSLYSGYAAKEFSSYQDMGSYLALVISIVWVARPHLRKAWQAAVSGNKENPDGLPYSWAIFGGLAGLALLVLLANHAGLSVPVAVWFFTAYGALCIAASWLTSNTGNLFIPISFRPDDYLFSCIGTRSFSARDIALLRLPSQVFTYYYREMLMPHYLNNFKLAEETGTPRQSLIAGQAIAVIIGLAVAWWAHLLLAYTKGAYALQALSYLNWSKAPFEVASRFIALPQGPDPTSYAFMAVGAGAFLGLSYLRATFLWWPLHPAGLLLGSVMEEQWLSIFIAWVCKSAILRYGGARTYQQARSLFLGLIVGEAAIGCVWIIVGFITGTGVRLLP